ncbi:MAG: hypothetical protein M1824_000488 [Vezdaea acicularis]|nr:MAG: hypothetical protein M1824_000488 [Vezdaea acicularis]
MESPPASPGLPSLTPHHGKKRSESKIRVRYQSPLRLVIWITGLITTLYLLAFFRFDAWRTLATISKYRPASFDAPSADISARSPAAVVVRDQRGRKRWTISIPSSYSFPLRPRQYADLCAQGESLSKKLSGHFKSHTNPFTHVDPTFIDVFEAEEEGLLPLTVLASPSTPDAKPELTAESSASRTPLCSTSLTFVLETSDAGLGSTLLHLWLSYGLAALQSRPFFISDTRWAYGKYTTYFAPPPSPSCQLPPNTQPLPYPATARHLVVSAATAPYIFGDNFRSLFPDTSSDGAFALMRRGYEALFHLNSADLAYMQTRLSELKARAVEEGKRLVGVHIRRGDRHPDQPMYRESYIPLDLYVAAARERLPYPPSLASSGKSESGNNSDIQSMNGEIIVVASDDPDVYPTPELAGTERAQTQILLASKTTLDAVNGAGAAQEQERVRGWGKVFKEENVGWEGGFFKDVFWHLGYPAVGSEAAEKSSGRTKEIDVEDDKGKGKGATAEKETPPLAYALRELVARAYLLDLAVLGGADDVVCAVGARGCRVLGVMMGWEKVRIGRWRNVDREGLWRGLD